MFGAPFPILMLGPFLWYQRLAIKLNNRGVGQTSDTFEPRANNTGDGHVPDHPTDPEIALLIVAFRISVSRKVPFVPLPNASAYRRHARNDVVDNNYGRGWIWTRRKRHPPDNEIIKADWQELPTVAENKNKRPFEGFDAHVSNPPSTRFGFFAFLDSPDSLLVRVSRSLYPTSALPIANDFNSERSVVRLFCLGLLHTHKAFNGFDCISFPF